MNAASLQISEEDLAQRRKTRVVDVKPVDKSSSTQWLSGTPQALAREIMNKIAEVR